MKKILFILAIVCIIASAVLLTRKIFPYTEGSKLPTTPEPSSSQTVPDAPFEATLSGEYTCLPHRDTRGPVTLECALGLKTAEGLYYSLDMQSLSPEVMNIETGKIITVSGMLVPIEQISSDHWQKYNIEGIMRVEKIDKN